ncbi:MAG: phosphotransferase [Ktedonobacteraceae bacterium]|nr:phosphotransferase [Ktedonobacteraceae bacterium]MBO0790434.1 phosphotransferase [Ktedonobacteraceae bacterium]
MKKAHNKKTASLRSVLPEKLVSYVGQVDSIEHPPQGTAFQVCILSSPHGRFILKQTDSPSMVNALIKECQILTALQHYAPFVAQPLGDAETDHGHAFLFTCIEGDPLHVALNHSSADERHHLIQHYAQSLRRVHGWAPDLSQPTDWLTQTLQWVGTNIQAKSRGACVAGTNSRFDGEDAQQLLAKLQAHRPSLSNDLVFCHGDYCLPNVIIQNAQVMGIIDWSLGGYADRRFDLATALFSMRLSLPDSDYLTTFLQAYGYSEPLETLEFFEALHALTCAFWQ